MRFRLKMNMAAMAMIASYLTYIKQVMGLYNAASMSCSLLLTDLLTRSLLGGTIEVVHATVNFGSRVPESFFKYRQYTETEPLMFMEYWNGWFDHWGEKHHTRDASDAASVFEEMLKENASVNFYMFHGGTNFGFYNGANCQQPDQYEPTITSYDYDALLTESGRAK